MYRSVLDGNMRWSFVQVLISIALGGQMPTSKFVVTKLPADQTQIRITSGAAVALFLAFIVAIFERRNLVYLGLTYIPITSAFLVIVDWITAAMLLGQAKALRASPLAVLAVRRGVS